MIQEAAPPIPYAYGYLFGRLLRSHLASFLLFASKLVFLLVFLASPTTSAISSVRRRGCR